MKKILMIAYHFPPMAGSSGIQRTLRFVQHLPSLGWQPLVLTVHPRAYENTSHDLLAEVAPGTVVRRTFALDTARHLQFKGRYWGWLAQPDRWVSWHFSAVRAGLQLIKEFKPDVIWSTYPIATAHMIAATLHRKSGLPWIADFRDPMAQEDFPEDIQTRKNYLKIEAEAVASARYCVFTTPGAARLYQQRYPIAENRMVVLENGYDEESFHVVEPRQTIRENEHSPRPLVMLHSGIVYPSERDPTQLFMALGRLKKEGRLDAHTLRLRFRAPVHDDLLASLAITYDVQDFIELCPPIAYRQALIEMMSVDALLVIQASNCNTQIPAKIYEYLRAGKPIVALTDPAGDTAGVLREAGLPDIARLDSADDIAQLLLGFVHDWQHGKRLLPKPEVVQQASRRGRSRALADLLARATTPFKITGMA